MTGPPWRTVCRGCADAPAPAPGVDVSARRLAGPSGLLAFDVALRGADAELRALLERAGARHRPGVGHVATLEGLPAIAAALNEDGYTLGLQPAVRALVQAHVAATRGQLEETDARLAEVRSELRARGLDLFPHQPPMIRWLSSMRCALNLDDMGLGKTIETALAAPAGAPIVVVATSSGRGVRCRDGSLLGGWAEELERWVPGLEITIAQPGDWRWPSPREAVLSTFRLPFPMRHGVVDLPGSPWPGTVLIVDECHRVKNESTQQHQRIAAMVRAVLAHDGWCYGLSGTPLENDPGELRGVLRAFGLFERAFGSDEEFHRLFGMQHVERYGRGGRTFIATEWGAPDPEVAERLRRVSMRREESEIAGSLPPIRFKRVHVVIDKATLKLGDAALAAIGIDVESIDPDNPILSTARKALAIAKTPGAMDYVAELASALRDDDPILVFSAHVDPVRAFDALESWAKITGDETREQRMAIVADFQAGRLRGLACTIRAAGESITLTRAANVVFIDEDWVPSRNHQAWKRIHRIGQGRSCLVHLLLSDHWIDRLVQAKNREKRMLIAETVSASSITSYTEADSLLIDRLESLLAGGRP